MTSVQSSRVAIGKTGVSVSRLCFGLAPIGDMPGTYGHGVTVEQAHATVNAIFDSEINFLDTARNYGLGKSEERIGEVIRVRGGIPKGFVISTKLDRDMDTLKFDGAQARRSLEQSLKALGVDHFGMLHLHDPEYASSPQDVEQALAELVKMKEEGLTKSIGLAAGVVDVMMPLLRNWDFDCLITHNRFTLVNRNAAPMMDLAQERGVAVLNAAPYASGVLAKGTANLKRYVYQEATAEVLAPVKRVEDVCAKHGIPPGAAALQFSMRDPRVASTIIGISKPERIAQTIEWSNYQIPEAAWDELLALPFESGDPEATRTYSPD
ncbi:aldo/keto reductase [Aestuariivirga litoralis]|uniref:aldo/keto reductase n=1 Tax=Aestuariivirga litoralis TaxID=2650924 RepID=UPI0018C771B4|nr:aldo/keto reductase [Aestuariivirga litoralis]MBG1232375.1 aldo/keto reductase [Aestuariivirga litoralis]